jgi:hypothetical protein
MEKLQNILDEMIKNSFNIQEQIKYFKDNKRYILDTLIKVKEELQNEEE